MLVTLVGLALILATAIALAWPLLSPPVAEEIDEGGASDPTPRLLSERDAVLAAIREADFDHETGKLSDDDYRTLRTDLEERALGVLAAVERSTGPTPAPADLPDGVTALGTRPPSPSFCPACGHGNHRDAQFCARCGRGLAPPRASKRRRRA